MLVWTAFIIMVFVLCRKEYKQEQKEYKAKIGLSKSQSLKVHRYMQGQEKASFADLFKNISKN